MKKGKVVSILAKRDDLILSHMALVERIARTVKPKLPPCFDMNDLVQAGMVGLIQAAADFNATKHPGVPFGAFARHRIKGEMIESFRKRNWEESTRPPILEHRKTDSMGEHAFLETEDEMSARDLEKSVEQEKLQRLVDGAINSLPRRQAVLIEMFYRGDLPIKDIAESVDYPIKASRVSQIHTQALRHMRGYFALRGRKAA